MRSSAETRKLAAFLAALAFFLSTIEYMIPKPLPFMRIGLANLPILLAVDLLPFGMYMALAFIKVFGMSILAGSLFSYIALFSFAGTISGALAMRALRKLLGTRQLSYIGLCVAGAFVSNSVQLFVAQFFIFGESARFMVPAFIALSLISGIALGAFAQIFAARSEWLAAVSPQTQRAEDAGNARH